MALTMTFVPSPAGSGSDGEPAAARSDRLPATSTRDDLPVPVRTIATGLLGAVLLAGGGIGAAFGATPDPVLDDTAFSWLGYGHGKQLAVAVAYAGIVLLVWAWVRLGRDARAGTVDRRGMLIAVGAWLAPLLIAPPLFSRDLFTYLAQGDLALHGLSPYHYGVAVLGDHLSANVDPTWQNTPSPYGPLFVLIAKSVVLITGQSIVVGVIALRATLCVGMLLLCWALPRLARRLGGSPVLALWLVAANPLVLTYLVGGGHNDLLMIGLLAAGTVLVLDGRHRRGVALVALAFAVKATAGVLLPFLVLIWARRLTGAPGARLAKAVLHALAVVVPAFAVCTLLAGVDLGWLPALSTSNLVVEWLSMPTAVGQLAFLVGGLFTDADLPSILAVTRTIGWLVLVVLVARQWWLARHGDPVTTLHRAALAMLFVALFSPATLPWYFTWPLVVAAGLAWSTRALVLATFGSVLVVLFTHPDGTFGLYDPPYLATSAVVAALAAVSLVRPDPLRRWLESKARHPEQGCAPGPRTADQGTGGHQLSATRADSSGQAG